MTENKKQDLEMNVSCDLTSCNIENELQQVLAQRLKAANLAYTRYNLNEQGEVVTACTVRRISRLDTALASEPLENQIDLEEVVSWLETNDCPADQDLAAAPVYALIRFSNEVITLQQSLNSLLPTINKGVLLTHPSADGLQDDGSLQVALEFVRNNPGFKLLMYPHPVFHANHPVYAQPEEIKRENYLDAYTSYGIQAIRDQAAADGYQDPWIFKVDGDQIYDSELLAKQLKSILTNPEHHDQVHYFAKIDVHYEPEQDKLYFLRVQHKGSNFLAKARYVKVGMVVERNSGDHVRAFETYLFENQSDISPTLKQSMKALRNFFGFRFLNEDTKAKFSADSATSSSLAQASAAQRYAHHAMCEVPVNPTKFVNGLHFKHLKHIHTGSWTQLPKGQEYAAFLQSTDYKNLKRKFAGLEESALFNNLELLEDYCHSMNFERAYAFKVLRDYYAQLRLKARVQDVVEHKDQPSVK